MNLKATFPALGHSWRRARMGLCPTIDFPPPQTIHPSARLGPAALNFHAVRNDGASTNALPRYVIRTFSTPSFGVRLGCII